MRPLFRLILFVLLVLIPFTAKSDSWEVLRGINDFTNTYYWGDTFNYSNGDTLLAFSRFDKPCLLWKYTDRQWATSTNLNQEILSATTDTALISFLNHPKFSIDAIDLDKENNMWINCKILPKMYSQFSINCLLKKTNNGITKYDKFYRADSNRYEAINNFVKVQFDNFNTPYIMCYSVLSTDSPIKNTFINNILKIEDDTLKLIKSIPSFESNGDKNSIIRFDSENNFWITNKSSLYYFAHDTIARQYSMYDLPMDSNGIANIGIFINIFLDKADNLTAVSNSDAIFTFSNNTWTLDTTASAFMRSVNLISSMTLDEDQVQMDTLGNLWLATTSMPFLMQREPSGKWKYHLIPNTYYSGWWGEELIGGNLGCSQIKLLDKGKIWLLVNPKSAFSDGLIYTTKGI